MVAASRRRFNNSEEDSTIQEDEEWMTRQPYDSEIKKMKKTMQKLENRILRPRQSQLEVIFVLRQEPQKKLKRICSKASHHQSFINRRFSAFPQSGEK